MADRNWDKELAKIDKQLESVSDEALFPIRHIEVTPVQREQRVAAQKETRSWGALLRLALAVLLGVGILFWPYVARCGFGLAAYLGAVTAVIVSGVWSAVWTWKHRTAAAHILSLLIVVWGMLLGAQELLPRLGYAKATLEHPAMWACQ